jgi:hypothetical protein
MDGRVYSNGYDGPAWSGWMEVPGDGSTDVALAAVVFNDKLHVFSRGIKDDRMYFDIYDTTGIWSGWGPLPGNQPTDAAVAAAAYDNKLFLFSKGPRYNRMYVDVFDTTDSWSTWKARTHWEELRGGGTTDVALAAAVFNNRLYVFARGVNKNDSIYVNVYSPTDDQR